MQTVSQNRSHGGTQGVYRHASRETRTDMTFSVYVPDHRDGAKLPVVWYLSGLTCTHANVTEKGEFRGACAEHGLIFVAPDTSPRGEGVPGDPANSYDFGLGAGFYVDATQAPFARNYRMWSYVTEELPKLVAEHFPVDASRQSIMGHSMGGHGALTVALRHPDRYRAASAFSPIVAPSRVPWGIKALGGYLGDNKDAWRKHDTVALIEDGAKFSGFPGRLWRCRSIPHRAAQARNCCRRPARRPASPSPCGARAATTTAIISSRPSWPIICAGTRRGSRLEPRIRQRAWRRAEIRCQQPLADEIAGRARPELVGIAAHIDACRGDELAGVHVAQIDVDIENEVRNLLHHAGDFEIGAKLSRQLSRRIRRRPANCSDAPQH